MQPELPDDELDDDDDELDDDELDDDEEELDDEAPDEDVTVEDDDDVAPPAPPPPSDEEGLGSRSELLPPQPAHRESPAQRVTAAAVRARIPSFYTISHGGDGAQARLRATIWVVCPIRRRIRSRSSNQLASVPARFMARIRSSAARSSASPTSAHVESP